MNPLSLRTHCSSECLCSYLLPSLLPTVCTHGPGCDWALSISALNGDSPRVWVPMYQQGPTLWHVSTLWPLLWNRKLGNQKNQILSSLVGNMNHSPSPFWKRAGSGGLWSLLTLLIMTSGRSNLRAKVCLTFTGSDNCPLEGKHRWRFSYAC